MPRYCSKCGRMLDDDAAYCKRCGNKVKGLGGQSVEGCDPDEIGILAYNGQNDYRGPWMGLVFGVVLTLMAVFYFGSVFMMALIFFILWGAVLGFYGVVALKRCIAGSLAGVLLTLVTAFILLAIFL